MEEADKEISEMKLSLNARARVVAESYLTAVRESARASTYLVLKGYRSSTHNA
jgi:actin related protein 2/3 complex subunit 4